MDVVNRKIADIRGEVEVDSEVGVGTTITIKLPLTLSIIDGLLVSINDTFYVIPLNAVDKIYAVEHKELVDKFNNVIVLDGVQIPFFYSTAARVVMCSITILSSGKLRRKGFKMWSIKTASRSKKSTAGSVTSPWIRRGMPIRCRRSRTPVIFWISVTPFSELVVAPAG